MVDYTKCTVLIVDDFPDDIQLVSDVLQKQEINVFAALDGVNALKIINERSIDLVLLDIAMPAMDGFEMCNKLKQNPDTQNIPVIFLTAYGHDQHIVRGFQIGAVDFITKPFNRNELLHKVLNHLELKLSKDTIIAQNIQLKKQNEEISALLNGTKAILASNKFKNKAEQIYTACKKLIGAQAGFVALVRENKITSDLLFLDSGPFPCNITHNGPIPIRGLRKIAYDTQQTVYDNNYEVSQHVSFLPSGHVPIRRVLITPLILEGEAVGLMGFSEKESNFTDNDKRIASVFAEYAAIALRNAQLFENEQKSRKHFQAIFENSNIGICLVAENGDFLQVNNGMAEIYGYSKAELEQKNVNDLTVEADKNISPTFIKNAITGEVDKAEFEKRYYHKNGHVLYCQVASTIVKDDNDIFFISHVKDISRQKRAEQVLRKSEEHYRTIFFRNHAINLLINPYTTNIVDANPAACEYYGYTHAEITAIKITDINTLSAEAVKAEMKNAREEKRNHFLFQHRLKSGELRHVEVYSHRMPIAGKTLLHSIIFDVEEKVEAEKQNRKLFAATVQSPATIVITDTDGSIEYVNPAFTKSTGYTPAEAIGENPRILKSGHTSPEQYEKLWETITSGQIWNGDFLNKRKDRSFFWENATIAPIRDSDGKITNYVAVKEDITERKAAEERLKELNAELSTTVEELNTANEELNTTNEELNATNEELNTTNQILERERKQFLALLDSIPELIYVADKETYNVLFTNKKLQEIIGRDITGEKCYKAIQNKDEVCDFCTNPIIFNQDKPYYWEYHNPVINRDFYIMDSAIEWTDGKKVRFELAIDITKRKEMEDAVRKSEEKYRLLAENASDVIWILNVSQKKFTYISPSVYQLRGFTVEEAMNQNIHQSLTPESAELVIEDLKKRIPQFVKNPDEFVKRTFRHELQQLCKNGEVIWIETSTRYRYNTDNEIEVVGISRNIEERKRQENKIKHRLRYEESIALFSNELLLDTPNAIRLGLEHILAATESSRVYIFENFEASGQQLAMKQINEVCAENVEPQIDNPELQHVLYDEAGFHRWRKTLQANQIISGRIADFPRQEQELLAGQEIKSILIIPLWVDKKWFGFIGFDDVAGERKWSKEDMQLLRSVAEMIGLYIENKQNQSTIVKHNRELKELNATKDKFFSIISHDLRNPFNQILGLSDLLMRNFSRYDSEKIQSFIKSIHTSSTTTFKLLENLLTWSRSQSGKIQYYPERLKIRELVDNSITLHQHIAKQKDIKLVNKIKQGYCVKADRSTVETIFRNLISNALKFTRKGTVSIDAKIAPDTHYPLFEIDVTDTGVGMSPQLVSKLFRIDENTSKEGTNHEKGTGLGLILCKEFVERNGGTIRVESAEGKGSSFIFTLPLCEKQKLDKLDDKEELNTVFTPANTSNIAHVIKDYHQNLKQELIEEVFPLFEIIQRSLSISKIKRFGKKVHTLGSKYHIKELETIGRLLLRDLEVFNIANVENYLKQFQLFVAEIKKK